MTDKQIKSIESMDAEKLLSMYTLYCMKLSAEPGTREDWIELHEVLHDEILKRLKGE